MAEEIKLTVDGDYDDIAFNYQILEIDRLNRVLYENGITDENLRRSICESFCFENAVFFDQGWLEVEGKMFCPMLGFAVKPLENSLFGCPKEVYLNSGSMDLHDYTMGFMIYYFDEKKQNIDDVKSGNISELDE